MGAIRAYQCHTIENFSIFTKNSQGFLVKKFKINSRRQDKFFTRRQKIIPYFSAVCKHKESIKLIFCLHQSVKAALLADPAVFHHDNAVVAAESPSRWVTTWVSCSCVKPRSFLMAAIFSPIISSPPIQILFGS